MADLGISHVPEFHDPAARFFLSEKGKRSVAKAEAILRTGKPSRRLELTRLMADLMALRTSAIDAAVQVAVANGTKQLVILGAGYDGRAWRMPELAGVKVFEVDHPATQREKRAQLAALPPTIADVCFVAVDFERESIRTMLERAGHDSSLPTCWIWEGVVMYLTHDAMRATLADIVARSAPQSTLIVNYHTILRGWLSRLVYRLLGEPQISSWTPEEMAGDLRAVGFVLREDSGMLDWNTRFANGEAKIERAFYMRIAVAELAPIPAARPVAHAQ